MSSHGAAPTTGQVSAAGKLLGIRYDRVGNAPPAGTLERLLSDFSFLLAAVAIFVVVPFGHSLVPVLAVISVVAFLAAEACSVPLSVGACSAAQPAFVVMLFAFPLNAVPLVVLGTKLLGAMLARKPVSRLVSQLGDSWFSAGPVVVLALAAPGPASWSHWPIYVAAFAAQFASDHVNVALCFAARGARGPEERLVPLPLLVDALVIPVGIAAAVSGDHQPAVAAALLAGPLGLMGLLKLERVNRIDAGQRALYDPLTGVANRRLFVELADRAAHRCQRGDTFGALLLLDLDRFKEVNDRHGHQRGDDLLTAFAARLRSCVRQADTVARLGGDEFAILLSDPADIDGAERLADKLRLALQDPLLLPDDEEVTVTASIGTAVFGADTPPREALALADSRMYADKRQRHTGAAPTH